MAFRELSVVAIREMLRRWKAGEGLRVVAAATGADRKTVRRYVDAAVERGFCREGGRSLDDTLLTEVIAAVLPGAPPQVGDMRARCRQHRELIDGWLKDGCHVPKIARLLKAHTGIAVPQRTISRFVEEEMTDTKRSGTVRIVDPPPGSWVEVDFMALGVVTMGGKRLSLSVLVCIAAYSRHTFLWPCATQTRQDVIDGLEAAWSFFGGVFPVVVTDNPKPLVTTADPLKPVLDEAFAEYSQSRGFLLDLARVRRPKDKPKVERTVPYARSDGFAGERFVDLDHVRRHAEAWCRDIAGVRVHGTTRRRPIEAFEDERSKLLPAPDEAYDPPTWVDLTVGRDHALVVAEAIYSVPHELRGKVLRVRYDRKIVKFYAGGAVVKVHPRIPRGTSAIDASDLPPGTGELATRDAEGLAARAASRGDAVGVYATRLLDVPMPWTRMRAVYLLLGLCSSYGDTTVDAACRQALNLDVVDVTRVKRMLERANPVVTSPAPSGPPRGGERFARDAEAFRVTPAPTGDRHATT
jgi:transposase